MTNLKTWMLHLATNPAAERSGETLIEKPPHVEPSRPLADEKPSGNGSHHPIRIGPPRVGRPMRLGDCWSDLGHRYPGAHPQLDTEMAVDAAGRLQRRLLDTLLRAVGAVLRGFRCRASVPLDQSSPCGEKRRQLSVLVI